MGGAAVENRNRAALDTFLRFDAEFPLFALAHTVRARVFNVNNCRTGTLNVEQTLSILVLKQR